MDVSRLKSIIAKKKQEISDHPVAAKKRAVPTDAELLDELRKRQNLDKPHKAAAAEAPATDDNAAPERLADSQVELLAWMKRTVGNLEPGRIKEAQEIVDTLETRLTRRDFPLSVCEGLLKAAKQADERKYREAHETYLEVAVGKAAWPVGVKGLQVKTRGCNDLIKPVHHVLDEEKNRQIMTTFKRLLSAVQEMAPPNDLAEKVNF